VALVNFNVYYLVTKYIIYPKLICVRKEPFKLESMPILFVSFIGLLNVSCLKFVPMFERQFIKENLFKESLSWKVCQRKI
jgi:hypothetical protein